MTGSKDERFTELPNSPSVYVINKSSKTRPFYMKSNKIIVQTRRQLPFIDTKIDKWIQINHSFAAHSNMTVIDYLN